LTKVKAGGAMDYQARWETIGELGSGGQGKVFRVMDKTRINENSSLYIKVKKYFDIRWDQQNYNARLDQMEAFRKAVEDVIIIPAAKYVSYYAFA